MSTDNDEQEQTVEFLNIGTLKNKQSAQLPRKTTSLIAYHSRGRLLVVDKFRQVGDEARATALLATLGASLKAVVLLDGVETDSKDIAVEPELSNDKVAVVLGSPANLSGHMGNFSIDVARGETVNSLANALYGGQYHFDLVLDLLPDPLFQQDVPPVGYYPTRGDFEAIKSALEAIPDMVGDFERPVFVEYDSSICAHGRSGIGGCTKCLDACPTMAIKSLRESIELDHYLCQGGGVCASACPSGALSYVYPAVGDLVGAVRRRVSGHESAEETLPAVLFHDADQGANLVRQLNDSIPAGIVAFQVEEAPSVGLEAWLALFASGIGKILMLTVGVPDGALAELRAQVKTGQAILGGLGHPESAIEIVDVDTPDELLAGLQNPEINRVSVSELASFVPPDNKRTAVRVATDHLFKHARQPRESVSLPSQAPFGRIVVDDQKCTLCMACVSVCPGRALEDGQDLPQLKFIEANCLQCGICQRACPESAIELEARYVYDSVEARQRSLLHEESPFCCIRCGTPFTTQKMIDKMGVKLAAHWMFQEGDALTRLQMCEDCRVKDMFLKSEEGIDVHKP